MANAEAEENFKKADFNFMVELNTLIHKNNPKLLKLRIYSKNNQKERATKKFSPVFTEPFRLVFAGDKIVLLEELKEQVVGALHLVHPQHGFDESAGQGQHILVGRDAKGHRRKM